MDLFEEIPQEQADLEIAAEIDRLNFGGMPMNAKCYGEKVKDIKFFYNF